MLTIIYIYVEKGTFVDIFRSEQSKETWLGKRGRGKRCSRCSGAFDFVVELLFLAAIVIVTFKEFLLWQEGIDIVSTLESVLGLSWAGWACLLFVIGTVRAITNSIPKKESPLLNATRARQSQVVHKLLGQPVDEKAANAAKELEEQSDGMKTERDALEKKIEELDVQFKPIREEFEKKHHEKEEKKQALRDRMNEIKEKLTYAGLAKEVTPEAVRKATKMPMIGQQSLVPCIGWMLARVSPLMAAIDSKDPELVQALLDAGHSPNCGSDSLLGMAWSESPMSRALSRVPTVHKDHMKNISETKIKELQKEINASMKIVDLLLAAGASPHVGTTYGPFGSWYMESLVSKAVSIDQELNPHWIEIMGALLALGADPNHGQNIFPFGLLHRQLPLAIAVEKDNVPMMRQLLARGAWMNGTYNVGPLGLLGRVSLVRLAAYHKSPNAMELLLDSGASPNIGYLVGPFGLFGSSSPLSIAVQHDHPLQAIALLKKGAWPNYGWTFGPLGLLAKDTPISMCAKVGNAEIATALLKKKAWPNYGYAVGPLGLFAAIAPAFTSAQQEKKFEHNDGKKTIKHPEAACMGPLLNAGARPNLGRRVGFELLAAQTPIFTAAEYGHDVAVEALIDGGANLKGGFRILCSTVAKPLEWATEKGNTSTAGLLRTASGNKTK